MYGRLSGCSGFAYRSRQMPWEVSMHARMQQFMYFNPTNFLAIRVVDQVMDRRKRSVAITVRLTPDEKEAFERRAKALGISTAGFLRRKAMNAQQSIEEILAREWVAVALQIRKMQSDSSEKQQMQDILEQLKLLIAQTISR